MPIKLLSLVAKSSLFAALLVFCNTAFSCELLDTELTKIQSFTEKEDFSTASSLALELHSQCPKHPKVMQTVTRLERIIVLTNYLNGEDDPQYKPEISAYLRLTEEKAKKNKQRSQSNQKGFSALAQSLAILGAIAGYGINKAVEVTRDNISSGDSSCRTYVTFQFHADGFSHNDIAVMAGPPHVYMDVQRKTSISFASNLGRCIDGKYSFAYGDNPQILNIGTPNIKVSSGTLYVDKHASHCDIYLSSFPGSTPRSSCI